jgi:hypothetical protein
MSGDPERFARGMSSTLIALPLSRSLRLEPLDLFVLFFPGLCAAATTSRFCFEHIRGSRSSFDGFQQKPVLRPAGRQPPLEEVDFHGCIDKCQSEASLDP